MNDRLKPFFDAQKRLHDVMGDALDPDGKVQGGTDALSEAQDAARRAAEANLAAWQAWLRLWGMGPW